MFFMIRKHEGDEGIPDIGVDPVDDWYTWTLHRKDKGAPEQLGEALCRSVEYYATERQTRAAINTAKKAMQGVRFAQTRVAQDSA